LKGLVGDLPKILSTKHQRLSPQLIKLRELFWSTFAHAFYKKAYKNYVVKSHGGTDEFGVKWKPTKGFKKKRGKLVDLIKGAKAGAEKLILVKTGRLRDSFKPGRLAGSTYTTGHADQIFDFQRGKIKLGSGVPYAVIHDPKRPLLGKEDELVEYAIGQAYEALMKELQKIIK
jgi:hypothetical protein